MKTEYCTANDVYFQPGFLLYRMPRIVFPHRKLRLKHMKRGRSVLRRFGYALEKGKK